MFQFPAFAFSHPGFTQVGFPIRTSKDQRSFAAPLSFSQLTTSFVASESLGIHHALLFHFLLLILFTSLSLFLLPTKLIIVSFFPLQPVKDLFSQLIGIADISESNRILHRL